jgi:hypothetical protein
MMGLSWLTRRKLLIGGSLLLIAVLGVTLGAVIGTTQISDLTFSNRLAEIGDWVGLGTLLLAALAAVVALVAYAVSTGQPDLKLQISFPSSSPNQPVFEAEAEASGSIKAKRTDQEVLGRVVLENKSTYSARNPVVVAHLTRMTILAGAYSHSGWDIIEESTTRDVTAIQWDGGSDYSIHGGSKRVLPDIAFNGLRYVPDSGEPSIRFELLAEGYRRGDDRLNVPVNFRLDGKLQINRSDPLPPAWL